MSYIKQIVIPAATGSRPGVAIEVYRASVFHCIATDGAFQVQADNLKPVDGTAGRGFGTPADAGGKPWTKLALLNFAGVAVTVTIYQGIVTYSGEQRLAADVIVTNNNKNAPTYPKGSGVQTLPGPGAAFLGVDGGGQLRKIFAVKNLEATGSGKNINIHGASGTIMWILYPGEGHVLESGGAISLSGAGFQYVVEEVFYQ